MHRRHPPLPREWLMTDERMGEGLWTALARLPHGAGVVFRHYATPPADRRALFARVARIAARRRLLLVRAGAGPLGRGEGGVHGGARATRPGIRTWPAHSRREAVAAVRAGADLVFVSPVFATRSHPGARVLGPVRLGLVIRGIGVPVVALGGMDRAAMRRLAAFGIHGWAGIDAWAVDQKRNAVPT